MENLNEYKNSYESNARYFDENTWLLTQYGQLMCENIIRNNYKSVLSLGIGHSVVSQLFFDLLDSQLDRYHIVEGSSEIVNTFLQKFKSPKIDVFTSFFEEFTPKVKYDAIEMGFVLEHVDDPLLVINRFKEFLNEDGVLFIAVPNSNSLHRQIGYEAGLLANLKKLSSFDLQFGHKRYFDLKELEDLIASSGLRISERKGLLLKPITTEQVRLLGWSDNVIKALLNLGLVYPEISNGLYVEVKI